MCALLQPRHGMIWVFAVVVFAVVVGVGIALAMMLLPSLGPQHAIGMKCKSR